jgi:hypothetical protein
MPRSSLKNVLSEYIKRKPARGSDAHEFDATVVDRNVVAAVKIKLNLVMRPEAACSAGGSCAHLEPALDRATRNPALVSAASHLCQRLPDSRPGHRN